MDNKIPQKQHNNQLHGVKLVDIIERLVEKHGWEKMGEMLPIRCFTHDPSVKSSLKFLRKTPWARDKVEKIYMQDLQKQ
ncbi:VF530 family DNA-binding protein [Gillisia sp. CAL575]|uniref:VF530 family protein n=1 Tax=Gillisia sp. CAL575 TaxID=985255 RepID=UPI0003A7188F|nr:VF530 family protein [Gillisia sp. CAL575]